MLFLCSKLTLPNLWQINWIVYSINAIILVQHANICWQEATNCFTWNLINIKWQNSKFTYQSMHLADICQCNQICPMFNVYFLWKNIRDSLFSKRFVITSFLSRTLLPSFKWYAGSVWRKIVQLKRQNKT